MIRGSSELWKHFLPDTILQQLLIHICNIKLISYDKLKVQLIYTSSQHVTFVLCMHLMHPPREAASRGLPCSGTFTSRLFIAKNTVFSCVTHLLPSPLLSSTFLSPGSQLSSSGQYLQLPVSCSTGSLWGCECGQSTEAPQLLQGSRLRSHPALRFTLNNKTITIFVFYFL